MTQITVKYTLADHCLHPATLTKRVVMPTALGCCTLLLLRYALSWGGSGLYSEPSAFKYCVALSSIAVTAAIIYRAVLVMRISSKVHFLATYLKPDSDLHRILSGYFWNAAVSSIISLLLASLAYSVIQTYSWVDIVCLSLASAVGLATSQLLGYVATDSLKDNVSTLFLSRARRATSVCCVLITAVLLTLLHDTFSPLRHCDESEVTSLIKQDTRHPVLAVQRLNRAMVYFNAQLIRARDNIAFPFGWIAYLFLLVPNTVSLYALVCIFLGFDFSGETPSRSLRSLGDSPRGSSAASVTRGLCFILVALPCIGCGIGKEVEEIKEQARRVEQQIRRAAEQSQADAESALRETQSRMREAEAHLQEVEEKLKSAESRARDFGKDINDLMKDDRAQSSENDSPADQQ